MTDAEQIEVLKDALRQSILSTCRVKRWIVEYDPAGSTYAIDWSPEAKKWAALCDLDLDNIDPIPYER